MLLVLRGLPWPVESRLTMNSMLTKHTPKACARHTGFSVLVLPCTCILNVELEMSEWLFWVICWRPHVGFVIQPSLSDVLDLPFRRVLGVLGRALTLTHLSLYVCGLLVNEGPGSCFFPIWVAVYRLALLVNKWLGSFFYGCLGVLPLHRWEVWQRKCVWYEFNC